MPFLCVKFLINEYRDNSHLFNDWRDRWQERAGSNRKELVVVELKGPPTIQGRRRRRVWGNFLLVWFSVSRDLDICCVAAVVRCTSFLPIYVLASSFFLLISWLSVCAPPPPQQLSSYTAISPLSGVSRLLSLFSFSSFPVTILRRHPSELYAYLLWALTALCFGL